MDRVTLGVIMPGNRRCILKETKWQRILVVMSKFFWVYYLLAIAVVFYLFKVFDDHATQLSDYSLVNYLNIILTGVLFALVGWSFRLIYSSKSRCPCCKHLGIMRRISNNKLIDTDVEYVSRTVDDYSDGVAYNLDGDVTFYTNHSKHTEWDKKTTNTYTYNVRCKICGCVAKVKTQQTTTT